MSRAPGDRAATISTMKFALITSLALLTVALASPHSTAADPSPPPPPPVRAPAAGPELKDGDIVALIGNTFIEREGQYGYIETALTARYADRDIKFRNLGWSGDTVWCESRAYFGTPEDGFKHLLEHVDLVKPTVIILNYGVNEAFAGEAGLQKFIDGYNRLLDELEKRTKRIILLSPIPIDNLGAHVDGRPIYEALELYINAIRGLAARRHYSFIDIYEPFTKLGKVVGVWDGHLTEEGHAAAGSFTAERFIGGPAGALAKTPLLTEPLREAIIEKNSLFFHRHRPQNETYLRGFRKHEQGNNAVEIYEFEKLVAEKEKEIARLRGELLKVLSKAGDQ